MNRPLIQSQAPGLEAPDSDDTSAFFAWMHAWPTTRQITDSSRRAYRHEVRRLVTWCEHRNVTSPRDLDCDAMRDFFGDVASEKPSAMARIGSTGPLSPGSVTQARRIVNLLVHDAVADGLLVPDLLRVTHSKTVRHSSRKGSKPRKRLSSQSLRMLLFQPTEPPNGEVAVSLAFWCGLSAREISRLRWRHLRSVGSSTFLRITTSSAPARTLIIPQRLAQLLQGIRASSKPAPENCVFSSTVDARRPLSTRTIARWISRAAYSSGCDELATASSLRRAFAVIARQNGWRESEVLFRLRRQRISEPQLTQERGSSESNLFALETMLGFECDKVRND